MEFILGGSAAVVATVFTNPLDVVKIRMQLQGELKARGMYSVHYRNLFQALYAIGRADGVRALQKGLLASSGHQFALNAIRLGAFHFAEDQGWTTDESGTKTSLPKSVAISAVGGGLGALAGSPFYLVKTHMQSFSKSGIAVGYQHEHQGTFLAFKHIYQEQGIKGLWRGANSAVTTMAVSTATQLTSYDIFKRYFKETQLLSENPKLNSLVSGVICSFMTVVVKTPFDVVSTRIYNQGVNAQGKGVLYSGIVDCFVKIVKNEGILGLYKGFAVAYLRLGPHISVSLVIWDWLRELYYKKS